MSCMGSSYQKRDLRGVDSTRRERRLAGVREITYVPSPTAQRLHDSMKRVRGIRGPIGSGKSVACCWDLRFRADRMPPDSLGIRRSRFLISRSTFAQLKKTTITTWLRWFPDTEIRWGSPTIGVLRQPSMRGDGTTVEMELIFQGIRFNESLEALKSLDLSGAWLNEASDIREDALDVVLGRCGRYPDTSMVPGAVNLGVTMDTNSPGEMNWWYRKAELEKPEDHDYFAQPPAVFRREKDGRIYYEANRGQEPGVPAAENAANLADGYDYWLNLTKGAAPDYIKRFLMNEYTNEVQGAPVYHEYNDAIHFVNEDVEPMWGIPLIVGTDYGRTPCSVIGQVRPDSQIVVFDELCTKDCSIDEYVDRWLKPWLFNKYKFGQGARIVSYGDPAGANKEQGISMSVIQIMTAKGVPTLPCPVPNNDFMLRRDAVGDSLRRRVTEGKPGLVICRPCVNLRKGFLGDYHYRTMVNSDGSLRTADRPDKSRDDPASHVHDALQYMVYSALHPDGVDPFSTAGADAKLWLPRSSAGSPRTVGLDLAGYF